MSVLRTYAYYVIIISDCPGIAEVVIEYTKLLGLEILELIFKTKKENPRFIK